MEYELAAGGGLALALGLCLLTVVPSIATALVGIVSAVIAGVLRG